MPTPEEMLAVALEEARAGLAEGGIPIGAALFDATGTLLGPRPQPPRAEGDPSVHGETDAFRKAGRQRSYRDTIMVTTLAPCWYCSGLVRQFRIGTVVVGESVNFTGGVDWLREHGVKVIDLDSERVRRDARRLHRGEPRGLERGHRGLNMGIYGEHVLPRIVNVGCNMKAREQRARVCEGLDGEVVEIGFGSGLNIPFYPASVTRVAAVEPADIGWKLARKRLRGDACRSSAPVSTGRRCRSPTTASTRRCRPGRCARSPTSTPRCASCAACSSPAARCTSSSTASRRTRRCSAGSTGSSRCRSGCSAAATSPGRSSTC